MIQLLNSDYDNRQMLGKSAKQIEAAYVKCKRQYDDLLEKNQNDLIKIRIRQKTLNEKIISIQKERQQEVNRLKNEIQALREKLKDSHTTKTLSDLNSAATEYGGDYNLEWVNQKEKQISELRELSQTSIQKYKKLMKTHQEDVKLLKKEITDYKAKQQKMMQFVIKQSQIINEDEDTTTNAKLRDKQLNEILSIDLLSKLKEITEKYTKIIKEQSQKIQRLTTKYEQQRSNNCNLIKMLEQRLQDTNQELKRSQQQYHKLQVAYKIKEQELQQLNRQLQESTKKKIIDETQCAKCIQLEQQIQLHKQMLKSVRMMLKFKQMQLQKCKK